jgi:hypothetical protein
MNKPWLVKESTEENFVEVMGAKVFLKPLKYGKSRQALSVSMKIDQKGNVDLDSSLLATLRALYQIKSWELTDENDKELPVNLETIDSLNESFVEQLVSEINEKQGTDQEVAEDEKKQ